VQTPIGETHLLLLPFDVGGPTKPAATAAGKLSASHVGTLTPGVPTVAGAPTVNGGSASADVDGSCVLRGLWQQRIADWGLPGDDF
jgi:hypothetical protein